MSKKVLLVIAVGVSLSMAGAARAGIKLGNSPSVWRYPDGSLAASGTFAGARSSSNGNAEMHCINTPTYSACMAYSGTGDSAACITSDPTLMTLIRSVDANDYIYFRTDTASNCTYFYKLQDSVYAPKAP
jgi:hypothetical protein